MLLLKVIRQDHSVRGCQNVEQDHRERAGKRVNHTKREREKERNEVVKCPMQIMVVVVVLFQQWPALPELDYLSV